MYFPIYIYLPHTPSLLQSPTLVCLHESLFSFVEHTFFLILKKHCKNIIFYKFLSNMLNDILFDIIKIQSHSNGQYLLLKFIEWCPLNWKQEFLLVIFNLDVAILASLIVHIKEITDVVFFRNRQEFVCLLLGRRRTTPLFSSYHQTNNNIIKLPQD